MRKTIRLLILNSVCLLLFSGCSSTPAPHDWKSSLVPQPGKGLVVFYFTHISGVALPRMCIYVNDALITSEFHPDSFYTYQADPGDLQVYTRTRFGSSPFLLLDQAT